MALPSNEWLEIKSGPGTWGIIKDLFRDEEDQNIKPGFTVVGFDNSQKYFFEVSIRHVHRLPDRKFMVRGFVQQLDGHSNDWFTAHYNSETRNGLLKFEQSHAD